MGSSAELRFGADWTCAGAGSGAVPGRFRDGFREVPGGLGMGCGSFGAEPVPPDGFLEVPEPVPGWVPEGSGFREVAARFRDGFREVPVLFRDAFRKVSGGSELPARFRGVPGGSGAVPECSGRFRGFPGWVPEGSGRRFGAVPGWVPEGSGPGWVVPDAFWEVPARFRDGFRKVPEGFGFRESSGAVPGGSGRFRCGSTVFHKVRTGR